jgi:hypothetical protein
VPVQDSLKRRPGDPYPHGVAEAIVLALDAVADGDSTGLCAGLINAVALLSTAGASRQLLYAAGQQCLFQPPGTETAAGPTSIDEALGRLASASLLTYSVDDATVAAHRLTMRVAVERQAQDGSLTGLGASVAGLLLVVTRALDQPWRNRAAARDAIQQIMALHEHLAPYLGEQDAELIETLLRLRGWVTWRLNVLGDRFAQAIEYGQNLVADSERVLGETHPDTLGSRTTSPTPTRTLAGWTRPFRCMSAPSPTASTAWARPTPIPWAPATTSPTPTGRLDGWMRPSPSWSAPSPTASTAWARPTPIPWAPATTSPTPTGRLDGWTRPSPSWSAPSPTASTWARPTPAP